MAFLATVERLLNRWITESTAAAERLAALEGKSLAVELEGLSLRIHLRVRGARLALAADLDAPADATLKGTPLALLGALGSGTAGGLSAASVELAGRVDVAEGFAEALRLARPDAEAELAGWIGDIPAHGVGSVASALTAWARRAGRALEADLGEYLQEERELLPGAARARAFFADVERLRDDVERAAARLRGIERALGAGG